MKPRRILHQKTQRFLRGWREWHINLQSNWSPGAFYIKKHNDFSVVGGGLRRGCILIRNRDGWVDGGWWMVHGDEWWPGAGLHAYCCSCCQRLYNICLAATSEWWIQHDTTQSDPKLQVDSSWIYIKRLLRCQGCIFKGLDVSSTEWSDNGTQQSIIPSQCTVRAPGIFINLQYSTVSWTPLQNASGSLFTQKIWVLFLRYWVALLGQMKMQSNILISPNTRNE